MRGAVTGGRVKGGAEVMTDDFISRRVAIEVAIEAAIDARRYTFGNEEDSC